MDRDISSDLSTAADPLAPHHVVISVCTTCKPVDGNGGPSTGPDLLAALKAALPGNDAAITVRAVQCLSVCKRPATAAVSGPNGYAFIFGDLQIAGGAEALVSFARSYLRAGYGLVPWRERAAVLRKGMSARIPPAVWSPEDGRPPP